VVLASYNVQGCPWLAQRWHAKFLWRTKKKCWSSERSASPIVLLHTSTQRSAPDQISQPTFPTPAANTQPSTLLQTRICPSSLSTAHATHAAGLAPARRRSELINTLPPHTRAINKQTPFCDDRRRRTAHGSIATNSAVRTKPTEARRASVASGRGPPTRAGYSKCSESNRLS
jgi:hypothetical protein